MCSPVFLEPGFEMTTSSGEQGRRQSDFFDSFQSLKSASSSEKRVSLAMSTLRGYYGLEKRSPGEGFEMTALYRHHDGASSPHMNPPLSLHRKSRSVANSLMSANGAPEDAPPRPSSLEEGSGNNSGAGNSSSSPSSSSSEKWFEKLLRRRQKSESDFASYPPEKILREEETSCGSTMSTAITGKGLALRPKSSSSSSRTDVDHHHHHHHPSPFPMNLSGGGGGDSSPQAVADGVRKSSSTSCLQDAENGTFSSLWSTSKWSLKPDFQALSSAAIPIFDGLPKAIGKKNKTAVD
ncbi:hypothetical protein M569_17423 [Genlisea aurea]|uniref:Uncharacterized protein n=1 Tax=Genlisea aurea TaxID=192259 RepID=S8BZ31_9LAMI|nr:hypothetical protein M569_17423 [Genlisea aurea]